MIWQDIKPNNIFVKIKDYSLIESIYLKKVLIPKQNRDEEHYTVIPSQSLRSIYLLSENEDFMQFDIVLGDWGVASWTDKHLAEHITPITLRSPEVLIKAPWSIETDLWNLGAVLLEIYRGFPMFQGRADDGTYELKRHLGEFVDVFGPLPRALLEKGDPEIVGEIFDEEGRVKDFEMNRPPLNSKIMFPGLPTEEREGFVSFLFEMMKLDPAERPGADHLLRHPWLGALPPKNSPEKSPSRDSPYVGWRAILRKPFRGFRSIFRKACRAFRTLFRRTFEAFRALAGHGN